MKIHCSRVIYRIFMALILELAISGNTRPLFFFLINLNGVDLNTLNLENWCFFFFNHYLLIEEVRIITWEIKPLTRKMCLTFNGFLLFCFILGFFFFLPYLQKYSWSDFFF